MDKSTIQTITLVITILGAFGFLKSEMSDMRAEIADNRVAINNVRAELGDMRVDLAELKGVLQGRGLLQADVADATAAAN